MCWDEKWEGGVPSRFLIFWPEEFTRWTLRRCKERYNGERGVQADLWTRASLKFVGNVWSQLSHAENFVEHLQKVNQHDMPPLSLHQGLPEKQDGPEYHAEFCNFAVRFGTKIASTILGVKAL